MSVLTQILNLNFSIVSNLNFVSNFGFCLHVCLVCLPVCLSCFVSVCLCPVFVYLSMCLSCDCICRCGCKQIYN